MSDYLTWTTMWAALQAGELDLAEETFVDEAEIMALANKAIKECAAIILGIYEDYFLTTTSPNLSLVNGVDEVALPTDIYAMKIRSISYVNGQTTYEVKRIREWKKFLLYRAARQSTTSNPTYGYFLVNSAAGAPKIKLSPVPTESGAYLECWYVRTANKLTTGASVCDIPEFVQYIYDYIKVVVYEKEGHPMLAKAKSDLTETRQLMIDTLTEMVPDNDNEIQPDFSHYEEHT